MADKDAEVEFKKETVSKLLSSFFKEDKTRLSGDAALLMAEMLKVFVQEAAVRSVKQADSEDCDQVDIDHFEKILPQLNCYFYNLSSRLGCFRLYHHILSTIAVAGFLAQIVPQDGARVLHASKQGVSTASPDALEKLRSEKPFPGDRD